MSVIFLQQYYSRGPLYGQTYKQTHCFIFDTLIVMIHKKAKEKKIHSKYLSWLYSFPFILLNCNDKPLKRLIVLSLTDKKVLIHDQK